MSNFIYSIFIGVIDFGILHKYLLCFSNVKRFKSHTRGTIFIFCIVILSAINEYQNKNLNLLATIILIYLYSMCYLSFKVYYIILPVLYFGLGFLAELVGIVLLAILRNNFPQDIAYNVSILLCEVIRYFLVVLICQCWQIQFPKASLYIGRLLFLIPILSVGISCMTIYLAQRYDTYIGYVLCIGVTITVLLSNILCFSIFYKLKSLTLEAHRNDMLLQEAREKEKYYLEVENCNKRVQKIRHDLKNQLLSIVSHAENVAELDCELKKILGDLELTDKNIFTSNTIFNTVLINKVRIAESKDIQTSVSVLIPRELRLAYSDTGILLGNLFDNAIEACENQLPQKRWITVSIVYKEHKLVLKMRNSKLNVPVNIMRSSKPKCWEHGIGLQSVKAIIKKYDGEIDFLDSGEIFEVSTILYRM